MMDRETVQKVGAYDSQQKNQYGSRDIDARALLICASQMQACVDQAGSDFKAYGDAVRRNQKLWTIFQVAISDPENDLPKDLKSNLFNLSRYVDKTSFTAMTSYNESALKSLINVNRIIATGLAKKPTESSLEPRVAPQDQGEAPRSVMTVA